MEDCQDDEFAGIEQRIRTLTTILQNMNTTHPPTSSKGEVPSFLRHFASLLTCGDTHDTEAKKVVAVTGSITPTGIQTLVVVQNSYLSTSDPALEVEYLVKSDKTFEQVVNNCNDNASLKAYVSDLWAALASYDPQKLDDRYALSCFIVRRCFQKLSIRIVQDFRAWKVHVYQKLFDWNPTEDDLPVSRWINRPPWANRFDIQMEEKSIQKFGQTYFQWELSNATAKRWAQLLGLILQNLQASVDVVNKAKAANADPTSALQEVDAWCRTLHSFVGGEEKIVVQTLLTRTSLATAFQLSEVSSLQDDNAEYDGVADMRPEMLDSEGRQVLRYLKSIVTWHAAIHNLCNARSKFREFSQSLTIGLVEIQKSDVLNTPKEEICQEFFRRNPPISSECHIATQEKLLQYYQSKFTGTVHAEATLMGLLTYFSPNHAYIPVKYNISITNESLLWEIMKPTLPCKAIAISTKCCWCCNWLGRKLADISFPGSNGVVYAWSPPCMGIDINVLRDLENMLWNELEYGLRPFCHSKLYSCHSSDMSMIVSDYKSLFEHDIEFYSYRELKLKPHINFIPAEN